MSMTQNLLVPFRPGSTKVAENLSAFDRAAPLRNRGIAPLLSPPASCLHFLVL